MLLQTSTYSVQRFVQREAFCYDASHAYVNHHYTYEEKRSIASVDSEKPSPALTRRELEESAPF